jgi:N4-gp56 family major capsid protein
MGAVLTSDSTFGTIELRAFYEKTLQKRLIPNLVYNRFGVRKSVPGNWGNSINFRKFITLAAVSSALTEGTVPTVTAFTATSVTATVLQYGAVVQGSDLLDLVSIDPVITENALVLGEQAGNSMDKLTRAVLIATTVNVQYEGSASAADGSACSTYLSVGAIRKAIRTLKRLDVRPFIVGGRSRYKLITHPNAIHDLMSDTILSAAMQYNYGSMPPGQAPNLQDDQVQPEMDVLGVQIYQSTNSYTLSGMAASAGDLYKSVIFGQDAYGVIDLAGQPSDNIKMMFVPATPSAGNPLGTWWSQGWKACHAAVILNPKCLGVIWHTASAAAGSV